MLKAIYMIIAQEKWSCSNTYIMLCCAHDASVQCCLLEDIRFCDVFIGSQHLLRQRNSLFQGSNTAHVRQKNGVFHRSLNKATPRRIMRRFVNFLWCPKGRFVYQTAERRRQRHCNRVAVEQKFNTADLAEMTNSRPLKWYPSLHTTLPPDTCPSKNYNCGRKFCPWF